jgi:hypothetical protein
MFQCKFHIQSIWFHSYKFSLNPQRIQMTIKSVVHLLYEQSPLPPSVFIFNKTEKAYSLEYTNIQKVFFTPHHIGHSCTNVILVHFASYVILTLMLYKVTVASLAILGLMWAQIIVAQQWSCVMFTIMWSKVPLLHNNQFHQWELLIPCFPTVELNHADRHDQPIRCSSLILAQEWPSTQWPCMTLVQEWITYDATMNLTNFICHVGITDCSKWKSMILR